MFEPIHKCLRTAMPLCALQLPEICHGCLLVLRYSSLRRFTHALGAVHPKSRSGALPALCALHDPTYKLREFGTATSSHSDVKSSGACKLSESAYHADLMLPISIITVTFA